ncbi:MAG: amidohydrolase [Candidatus Desulfofervidaceae bacterium]|nr:amidohydrolase [Candidatus Desulfofervidaceae bacterium]
MEQIDLLISGAIVLPLDSNEVLKEAGVAIKDDTIVAIDKTESLLKRFSPGRHLHHEYGLIMPGLINGHTHIPMTIFRGLADDLPLMEWLTQHIFPLEKRLQPQWVYWGALLGCAEMIMSGTTCFCDMYLFADEVAKAVDKAGLRAVVGEVLYDFPSPNYGPLEKGFVYTENLIKKWQGHPRLTIAVEPHAVYTCSPELLKKSQKIAEKYQTPLVIHLSETQAEVKQTQDKFGLTPVEHLDKLGILNSHLIAAHCVWLTEKDMELLHKRQVKVIHNPESNLKLASGIAPIPTLIKRDVTVGLGTDGPASNNDMDMFLEMDTAAKIHKLHNYNPTLMSAWDVLNMATKNSARALGLSQIGTLTPGNKADLIVLDLNRPHLMPLYNPVSHLVYAASGKDVLTTVVNGKVLMENRKLLTLDLEEIYMQIKAITEKFTQ